MCPQVIALLHHSHITVYSTTEAKIVVDIGVLGAEDSFSDDQGLETKLVEVMGLETIGLRNMSTHLSATQVLYKY